MELFFNLFSNIEFFLPIIMTTYIYLFINFFFKSFSNKLLILNKNKKKNFFKLTLKINNLNIYNDIFIFVFNFIILNLIFLYFIYDFFYGYSNNCLYLSFNLKNSVIIYLKTITLIAIFSFYIFKKNINFFRNYELIIGFFFFFTCIQYYLIINNLLTLIFIFEFQSIIFIFILSNLFFFDNNNNLNEKILNKQPLWYFLAIFYQFLISFLSTIFIIYTLLMFLKSINFVDWMNIEIFLFFLIKTNFLKNNLEFIFFFLPLIVSFLLKFGLLPFFFWKPEIYKNFNIDILNIYMVSYVFTIIYFFIFLISEYFFLINEYILIYFNLVIIISLIVLPIIFYSITEIRVFLAYSTIFHIIIIISTLFYNSNYYNVTFVYLFSYLFFIQLFLLLLYYLSNLNLWYFNEFQNFLKYKFINITLINIFLGMAGIPPFLGFFSKIFVITYLAYNENYFLFILFLLSGLIISFYYIQNYRFLNYNLKNLNFSKNLIILKLNNSYINLISILLFINLFSFLFLNDINILVCIFKIN